MSCDILVRWLECARLDESRELRSMTSLLLHKLLLLPKHFENILLGYLFKVDYRNLKSKVRF